MVLLMIWVFGAIAIWFGGDTGWTQAGEQLLLFIAINLAAAYANRIVEDRLSDRIADSALVSMVPGHQGLCYPTWLNRNQVEHRFDGGVTGFFKRVQLLPTLRGPHYRLVGEDFHGIIRNGRVYSTAIQE